MSDFTETERYLNEAIKEKFTALQNQYPDLDETDYPEITLGELWNMRLSAMEALSSYTGRNVICYVSSWLHNTPSRNQDSIIHDGDMYGFMNAIAGLDRSKGLDLLLHTPGGVLTATESIVKYLRYCFQGNIRVIVPHLAMSAGTMMACASKEILMGRHSSLGPIDPQFGGRPAQGFLKEFDRAMKEVLEERDRAILWREIIKHYRPTLIGECENATRLAEELVRDWLKTGMFEEDADRQAKIERILSVIGSHDSSKVHDRHYGYEDCRKMGLKVAPLEGDQELQDLVLSLFHTYVLTVYRNRGVAKLIENGNGKSFIIDVERGQVC